MSIHAIASGIAEYLARQTHQSKAVLTYGIEIILGAVIKLSLITVASYLLGIITPTLTLLFAAALLRIVSGGAHCSSYRRCVISGMFVFLSLGFIISITSPMISYNLFINLFINLFFANILFILTVILIWVPGGTENRSFFSRKSKRKFKFLSLIISFIANLILFLLYEKGLKLIAYSALLGLSWQAFSVTPLGYRLLKFFDFTLLQIKI